MSLTTSPIVLKIAAQVGVLMFAGERLPEASSKVEKLSNIHFFKK